MQNYNLLAVFPVFLFIYIHILKRYCVFLFYVSGGNTVLYTVYHIDLLFYLTIRETHDLPSIS